MLNVLPTTRPSSASCCASARLTTAPPGSDAASAEVRNRPRCGRICSVSKNAEETDAIRALYVDSPNRTFSTVLSSTAAADARKPAWDTTDSKSGNDDRPYGAPLYSLV